MHEGDQLPLDGQLARKVSSYAGMYLTYGLKV